MKISITTDKLENKKGSKIMWKTCILAILLFAGTSFGFAQESDTPVANQDDNTEAKVIGLKHISVHVLELEKSLKLYQEILGFKMHDARVLHGPGLEGMLVMKLRANDLTIGLSVTAPEFIHTIGPIGNTNHNHFMLQVNDIGPIGDKLKEEGYELENEEYRRDKYTFFVGPNGEIIGLSEYD